MIHAGQEHHRRYNHHSNYLLYYDKEVVYYCKSVSGGIATKINVEQLIDDVGEEQEGVRHH